MFILLHLSCVTTKKGVLGKDNKCTNASDMHALFFDNFLSKHFVKFKDPGVASPPTEFDQSWPAPSVTFCQMVSEKLGLLGQDTDTEHRHIWEQGQPDYKGVHSFDNILNKLNENLLHQAQKSKFPVEMLHHHERQVDTNPQDNATTMQANDPPSTSEIIPQRMPEMAAPKNETHELTSLDLPAETSFDFVLHKISASLGSQSNELCSAKTRRVILGRARKPNASSFITKHTHIFKCMRILNYHKLTAYVACNLTHNSVDLV